MQSGEFVIRPDGARLEPLDPRLLGLGGDLDRHLRSLGSSDFERVATIAAIVAPASR